MTPEVPPPDASVVLRESKQRRTIASSFLVSNYSRRLMTGANPRASQRHDPTIAARGNDASIREREVLLDPSAAVHCGAE